MAEALFLRVEKTLLRLYNSVAAPSSLLAAWASTHSPEAGDVLEEDAQSTGTDVLVLCDQIPPGQGS